MATKTERLVLDNLQYTGNFRGRAVRNETDGTYDIPESNQEIDVLGTLAEIGCLFNCERAGECTDCKNSHITLCNLFNELPKENVYIENLQPVYDYVLLYFQTLKK